MIYYRNMDVILFVMGRATMIDGTRFVTEDDVDRDFTGQWVLLQKAGMNCDRN